MKLKRKFEVIVEFLKEKKENIKVYERKPQTKRDILVLKHARFIQILNNDKDIPITVLSKRLHISFYTAYKWRYEYDIPSI